MNATANSAQGTCNYCGATYDAKYGNHICSTRVLEIMISDERKYRDDPDERDIAKWEARIAEVKAFWKARPKHQGELSHSISS